MRELLTIRPAIRDDVPALVELRLANAEAHLALDRGLSRPAPPRAAVAVAVARHFTGVLAGGPGGDGVLVAETPDGRVVGMVEVVRTPERLEHQILRPEPSAQVHTVVLPEARGLGVGSALLGAAARWAFDRGITYLSAGIHHRNAAAVRFYGRHGYADSGRSLGKRLA
jgi:GNAT superfamily N-acetyltransferase